jgi:S-adenosylmethionine:tRNA ribosyltransferase-isomerase
VRLEELDFDFPEELIAQRPLEPRDSCRLMHLRAGGGRGHVLFSALPDLLRAGDTLVFNDSRVLPARVHARKTTGGEVEILFLRPLNGDSLSDDGSGVDGSALGESWEALARPSHRLRAGQDLLLADGERLTLRTLLGEGRWVVQGPPGRSLVAAMEAQGLLPLPPYIKTYPEEPASYQTVYARVPGSAAAPTAGLHFTPELLRRLEETGIRSAFVTLHVGLDTFQPIRESIVEDHRIHRETYSVGAEALRRIRDASASGRRLVAVGTTATRVLETLARTGALDGAAVGESVSGSTDIFITPGHRFRAVDALLTNLHLPRSSVLTLTMAFAGVERLREAYREAIALRYRFFSFGDAMLIERPMAKGGGCAGS